MALTFEPIGSTLVSTPVSSVTFSSIPQTYTNLRLIANITGGNGADNAFFNINGDTTNTNYFGQKIWNYQANQWGYKYQNRYFDNGINFNATTNCTYEVDFFQYSRASIQRTGLFRVATSYPTTNNGASHVGGFMYDGTTNVITSLTFGIGGNLSAGSTVTLYGIKAA